MARRPSGRPTKAELLKVAQAVKLRAKKARLDQESREAARRIAILEAPMNEVARQQETRDKILIAIAALKAAEIDPLVKAAIDTAIDGLDERDREHLEREKSLWSRLKPLPVAAVPGHETPPIPNHTRVEDALLDGDQDFSDQPQEARAPATTSTADLTMQVLPTADWRWYGRPDDANTDKPMKLGMSATGELWLANTQAQVDYANRAQWKHIPEYDGLRDMAEIEAWIDNSVEQDRLEAIRKAAEEAARSQEDESQKEIARLATLYVQSKKKGSRKKPASDSDEPGQPKP